MNVTGIVWMGVRTPAFADLFRLFETVMNLEVTHETDAAAWFRLANGDEIQMYSDADTDHNFFEAGPTVGFRVDNFVTARAELVAAGIELIGQGEANAELAWQHFRGPDGNVYEIMGSLASEDRIRT